MDAAASQLVIAAPATAYEPERAVPALDRLAALEAVQPPHAE
jgi:hypothetical protein